MCQRNQKKINCRPAIRLPDKVYQFINSLTMSGLTPPNLNIKVGVPIMLLRNMDPARGHYNGTLSLTSAGDTSLNR